ncbi:myotubularin-related protein 11 isoform X2 [Pleurodeles waltl]|uniref:myotubularin-related protein 11 isoform X2 n=1 Tax=Pleurodeles waltl TaxID=8319 RepID=UPI0037096C51
MSLIWPPKGTKIPEISEQKSRNLAFKCLPGEHVYEAAVNVRKSVSYKDSSGFVPGTLCCTNLRVAFRPERTHAVEDNGSTIILSGEHDVALPCIEKILAVNSLPKTKVLTANTTLKFIPEELLIYCRDFRIMHFYFNQSGLETQAFRITNSISQALQVCSALMPIERAVPWSVENGGGSLKKGSVDFPTLLFETSMDWENELKRIGALDWRVSPINERFDTSASLSKYFLVPSKVLDTELKRTFAHFNERRIPRLSWRHPGGSDLLRAANFQPNTDPEKEDLRFVEMLMFANHSQCVIVDTVDELPNLAEIQMSYLKLRSLCMNENSVAGSDEKWLSSLEGTHWLDYVRSCLKKASDISCLIAERCRSVVLQEVDDRDLNCLLAALIQVISDPHARTFSGFQSLVQKEWVAAGHPFRQRFGILKEMEKDQSPVFHLFLDCVWQLLQQFPASFEFTEMYLTAMHDITYQPFFSTFIYNCQWERGRGNQEVQHNSCRNVQGCIRNLIHAAIRAQRQNCGQMYTPINGWRDFTSHGRHMKGGDLSSDGTSSRSPSVWEWSLSCSHQQRAQFRNPVYKRIQHPEHSNGNCVPSNTDKVDPFSSGTCAVYLLQKGCLTLQTQFLPWKAASNQRRGARRAQSSESLLSDHERSLRIIKPTFTIPHSGQMLLPLLTSPRIHLWRRCYLRGSSDVQLVASTSTSTSLAKELQLLQEKLFRHLSGKTTSGTDPQADRT